MAATNTYGFDVPYGVRDLDVSVALADDPQDVFIAELIDPNGLTVSYTTNAARKNASGVMTASLSADLYALSPVSGEWSLIVEWLNPVSGLELNEPFSGTIQFDQVNVTSDLPNDASIANGATQTFDVKVTNSGDAPEEFFVDPRLNQSATIDLRDQNFPPTAANMTLPLSPGLLFPYYAVPSETTQLQASVNGTGPVTFDLQYYSGDPDVTPGLNDGFEHLGIDSRRQRQRDPQRTRDQFWDVAPEPRRDRSVPEHGGADDHGERVSQRGNPSLRSVDDVLDR